MPPRPAPPPAVSQPCTCPLHLALRRSLHLPWPRSIRLRPHPSALPAALNMAVFLLIGRTSALTMNIAGVVKDWLLIGLSVLIFM